MRIGGHFSDVPPVQALQQAQRLGMRCCQIFLGASNFLTGPRPLSAETITEFNRLRQCQGSDIEVACHAPYTLSLAYAQSDRYIRSLSVIADYLRTCDALGIHYLVCHVGSYKDATLDASRAVRSAVRSILELMPNSRTSLLLENSAGGGTQFGHLTDLVAVVKDFDHVRVGLCLDTAHAYADGVEMESATVRRQLWQQCGQYVRWVHYNNPDPNVRLGGHLDRHHVAWLKAKWPVHTMVEIAQEFGRDVSLCMEAREDSYDSNLQLLEEADLI